jgi:hypothetical protein
VRNALTRVHVSEVSSDGNLDDKIPERQNNFGDDYSE